MGFSQREELIVQLLRARDFAAPGGKSGEKGSGVSVALLPHDQGCRVVKGNGQLRCTCWLRSYAEIVRCLKILYSSDRPQWSSVHKRFIGCDRRPVEITVRKGRAMVESNVLVLGLVDKTRLNKRGDGTCRVLVERWDPSADSLLWEQGVRALARLFKGPLNLPREMISKQAA